MAAARGEHRNSEATRASNNSKGPLLKSRLVRRVKTNGADKSASISQLAQEQQQYYTGGGCHIFFLSPRRALLYILAGMKNHL